MPYIVYQSLIEIGLCFAAMTAGHIIQLDGDLCVLYSLLKVLCYHICSGTITEQLGCLRVQLDGLAGIAFSSRTPNRNTCRARWRLACSPLSRVDSLSISTAMPSPYLRNIVIETHFCNNNTNIILYTYL